MTFLRRRYSKDNWAYLLAEGADAALVDPGDAAAGLWLAERAEAAGARVRAILHTHGHFDHTDGSAALRARLGVPVCGHGADAAWFAPDRDLAGERALHLGALALEVIPAPGHTPGSVLFRCGGRLLTGDTLFRGGSGNCKHGGDSRALARTFLGVLAGLDGALELHPGHDYAEVNLPFVLALEPGNAEARAALDEARAAHARGEDPPAGTLARERAANPFLRAGDPAVSAALAGRVEPAPPPGEETFLALRRLKDAW
ncbi:MAG TPA: MBL fold metallo-hydrolase [Anaeromyxobacteraceae bacterium]|nr:MBL fold metallo-hydrolase [Anaeromyxobacteraceae bacterium]